MFNKNILILAVVLTSYSCKKEAIEFDPVPKIDDLCTAGDGNARGEAVVLQK